MLGQNRTGTLEIYSQKYLWRNDQKLLTAFNHIQIVLAKSMQQHRTSRLK